jgi:hypothetical protein
MAVEIPDSAGILLSDSLSSIIPCFTGWKILFEPRCTSRNGKTVLGFFTEMKEELHIFS